MNKNTTFFILFISVMLALLVYGCSGSGHSIVSTQSGESVVFSREVLSDKQGRVPAIILPSGVKIEASEDNTLASDIVVTVIEKKITRNYNNAVFDDHSNTSELLYEISAFRNPSSSLENKTYVSTLEKPFKITIPKAMVSEGVTFMGIKESETDPWRYFNILDSDEVLANISGLRASGASKTEYTFNIFKLGVQLVLVNFNGNSDNKLPETIVTSLIASSPASIHVKDGKYLEDIRIKGILKGVKLNSIKPANLRARITYRNDMQDEVQIKVNGAKVTQTNRADKTIPGYSYSHSFYVENVVNHSLMSTNGEFEFTLNLEGVETSSFPSGFLIEFYNRIDNANILPYIYAEFYRINQIEAVGLVLKSEDGNIVDEVENLFCLNPVFTVTSDYNFSDADKKKISDAISVSGIDSEKITKTWNDQTLTISFAESLQPNMEYAISISEVSDIENTSIIPFELFNFTTVLGQCDYTVVHQRQNIADDDYTLFEEETKTAQEKSEITPEVKTYKGFDSPEAQTIIIASGSENRVVYSYNRKVSDVIIHKGIGIDTVSGEGSYRFGATIVASCTMKKDFAFDKWTDSEGKEIAETFTMPDTNVEITANAQIDGYAVIINKGRGVADVSGDGLHAEGLTVTASCTMLDGYVFDKWTDSEGNEISETFTMPAGNVIMTANAKPVTYEIVYNLAGGNQEGNNPTRYTVETETFSVVNPTNPDYIFAGWTGTGLDSASMTLSIVQGSTGNREYTANWGTKYYNLTINKTAGIDTVTGDGKYEYNSEVTVGYTLLTGYEFDSWTGDYTSETFTMQASNATMTANARPIVYDINYEPNGGIFVSNNPNSYDITSATITLNNPTKADYDFLGWEGTDIPAGTASMTVTIPQGSIGARNYVASFSLKYQVSYDLVNGTVADANPESYNFFTPTITLNNPAKENYDFLGWEGTGIPAGTASMTVTIPQGSEGARSYTASFTQKFVIAYDLKGGSLETENPSSYNEYTETFVLNRPTKEGYDFIGWEGTEIPEGMALYDTIIYKGSTGPRNYIASYTPRYTITYNLNGGSLRKPNPDSYNIYSDDITLNNPVRLNYAFAGWKEETATFSKAIVKIPQGSTGNKVYNANWHESITFTLPGGIPLVVNKCPAGTFVMGSPAEELGRGTNESQHNVTISKDFYMGKFEVTQEQYQAVMNENPSYFKSFDDSATRPVENLKCDKALAFCASLTEYLKNNGSISANATFTLPTEAQWEYACRAGTTTSLNSWEEISSTNGICNFLDKLAWYDKNSNNATHPVGKKQPNNWDLYDMHGNIQEFCKDLRASNDSDYSTEDVVDPCIDDPSLGQNVVRSGSYENGNNGNARRSRSAARQAINKGTTSRSVGFRVIFVKE